MVVKACIYYDSDVCIAAETLAYSRPKFRVGDTFDVIVLSAVNPDNVVIRSASLSDDFDQLCVALKEKYSGLYCCLAYIELFYVLLLDMYQL